MKKTLLFAALCLLVSACQKDNSDPRFNDQLSWKVGEDVERVEEEVLVSAAITAQLILDNINFCAGAHAIEVEIRHNSQLLFEDTVLDFPKVIDIEVPNEGQLQVSTKVVLGPALILCVRMGTVQAHLNF